MYFGRNLLGVEAVLSAGNGSSSGNIQVKKSGASRGVPGWPIWVTSTLAMSENPLTMKSAPIPSWDTAVSGSTLDFTADGETVLLLLAGNTRTFRVSLARVFCIHRAYTHCSNWENHIQVSRALSTCSLTTSFPGHVYVGVCELLRRCASNLAFVSRRETR